MQWLSSLPARTIRTFNNLATLLISQFAANMEKRLELTDLFDIKQMKGENLKGYLARFNSAMKGLHVDQFNDSLALRKHIEAKEDLADCLEAERQPPTPQAKPSHNHPARAHPQEEGYITQTRSNDMLT
ncbi:hypothetical protein CR513_29587, partial [Mucuna pruriens]